MRAGAEARQGAAASPASRFELTDRVREQIKMLPFKPTGAQKRVLGGDRGRHGASRIP